VSRDTPISNINKIILIVSLDCLDCPSTVWTVPPLSGLSHPLSGLSHPQSGLSHPLSGLSHPLSGLSHPLSGLSHPLSGLSHPLSGLAPAFLLWEMLSSISLSHTNPFSPHCYHLYFSSMISLWFHPENTVTYRGPAARLPATIFSHSSTLGPRLWEEDSRQF